jgi:hypothetical protein
MAEAMAEEVATWCQYYKTFISHWQKSVECVSLQAKAYQSRALFRSSPLGKAPDFTRLTKISEYKHPSLFGLFICDEEA